MGAQKVHSILYVIARYFLATVMLAYGIAKILRTQFSLSPVIWDKTVGELSGFELAWVFYGYSYWYGIFIACIQIGSSLLLFFRETTRLGIVIYLSIIINILAINITYEIDAATGTALFLTIIALYVFFSDFKAFKQFFINTPSNFKAVNRPKWLNKLSRLKYIYVIGCSIGLFVLLNSLKKMNGKNEFYGAWQSENQIGWSRIYFQEASTFSIRGNNDFDELFSGKYKIDRDAKNIEFISVEKDYLNEGTFIFTSDSTRMKSIIKGKYEFTGEGLNILNDTLSIKLIKLN